MPIAAKGVYPCSTYHKFKNETLTNFHYENMITCLRIKLRSLVACFDFLMVVGISNFNFFFFNNISSEIFMKYFVCETKFPRIAKILGMRQSAKSVTAEITPQTYLFSAILAKVTFIHTQWFQPVEYEALAN